MRVVTSAVIDIENIAGWSGQENWFYITLNGTYLSPSSVEYIEIEENYVHVEINEYGDVYPYSFPCNTVIAISENNGKLVV